MAIRGDDPLRIQWRAGHTSFAMTEVHAQARRFESAFGAPFAALSRELHRSPNLLPEGPSGFSNGIATSRNPDANHTGIIGNSAIPTGIEASAMDEENHLEILDDGAIRSLKESPRFTTSDDEPQRADNGGRAMLERAIEALRRALGTAPDAQIPGLVQERAALRAELDDLRQAEVAPNVIPLRWR